MRILINSEPSIDLAVLILVLHLLGSCLSQNLNYIHALASLTVGEDVHDVLYSIGKGALGNLQAVLHGPQRLLVSLDSCIFVEDDREQPLLFSGDDAEQS
jgi:hypothetical protein